MKLHQVKNYHSIYESIKTQKLPLKLSYKLVKIYNSILEELDFYEKSLSQIIEQYGLRTEDGSLKFTEDGNSVCINPEYFTICKKKVEELESMDFTTPPFRLTLEELDSIELTPEQVEGLIPFIKD